MSGTVWNDLFRITPTDHAATELKIRIVECSVTNPEDKGKEKTAVLSRYRLEAPQ